MIINLEFFMEPKMLDVPNIYVSNVSYLRFRWQLVILEGLFRITLVFLYFLRIWPIK